MKRIYANLIGNWIDITDTGTIEQQDPGSFIEENLYYKSPDRKAKCFEYDYVHIQYEGADYRIHPSMIQIVHRQSPS